MFSLIQPHLQQISAEHICRGHVVSFEGNRHNASIVEWCKDKGANVIVKLVGEAPMLVSKDRRVSIFQTQFY
ncbi:hypothetical protein KW419_00190 [Vibrio fluvialis]|nr:hypothetical protein [Vibrio vulnificus]MBY7856680.1 hypothetical protein [Vibrio fluvialis]MCU8188327.1 hypothetical protein [Vibrio vulnificus]MCU8196766.1 hypothetical protein [Vibrio vulnificus]MCU8311265.1 hypothetical protein [Vibrio vulnificus]RZQ05924.1 hypothetical protein D8T37_08460 [Vibrio vulnificus]